MTEADESADRFTEALDQHTRATASFDAVLDGVAEEHLGRPTPCADWDLQALLQHQHGQNLGLAEAIRTGADHLDIWAPRPLGAAGARAVTESAADLARALREPTDQDHPVWMPEITTTSALTLAQVATIHLVDTAIHAWDVARSLDVALDVDADIVHAVQAVLDQIPDGPQRDQPGSAFARRLPGSDERGMDGLLRSVGRDPDWTPE